MGLINLFNFLDSPGIRRALLFFTGMTGGKFPQRIKPRGSSYERAAFLPAMRQVLFR